MSEQENKEVQEVEKADNEQSTLFANPTEFYVKERAPKRSNLLLTSLVALGVVVLVAAAAVGIKVLAPNDDDQSTSSTSQMQLPITAYVSDDVEKMSLETKSEKVTFYSQLESTSSDSTTFKWYIEGVDGSLTDSFAISQAVDGAVALNALRKMDIDSTQFGFDKPFAKLTLESRNQKFEGYTITVGSPSPDRSGYYVKTSLNDEVYLVEKETVEEFCKEATSYANTTVISAFGEGDAPEEYFSEQTLLKVDEIHVSGTNYEEPMSFKLNPDSNTAPFMTYVMTAPYKRYADNDSVNLFALPFINGIYAEKVYTFDADYNSLKEYGLTNPQIVLTLRVGNTQHTLKATKNDDGYYAVTIDDCSAIYQVPITQIEYKGAEAQSFISRVVFSEMLKDFKAIDVTIDGKLYDFDINVIESEEEEDVYNITAGSLPLEAENFQNYYAQLLGMTLTEISIETPDATPSMTVRLTRKNGSATTIAFAQTADRRYHVSVDGDPGGYVSTTTYENLVSYATLAYEGKDVPRVTQQ